MSIVRNKTPSPYRPCFGCGANIVCRLHSEETGEDFPEYSDAVPLHFQTLLENGEWQDEIQYICQSEREGAKVGDRYHVKTSCARKAFEKKSMCPGCGKPNTWPGTLCESCRDQLAAQRTASAEGVAEFYVLDRMAFPDFYDTPEEDGGDTRDRIEALLKHLAAAVTERGHAGGRFDHADKVLPSDTKRRGYGAEKPSGIGVKLTAPQAAELDAFLKELRDVFERQRRAGRHEGKALLAGLASGKLNVSEFEEQAKKWEEP